MYWSSLVVPYDSSPFFRGIKEVKEEKDAADTTLRVRVAYLQHQLRQNTREQVTIATMAIQTEQQARQGSGEDAMGVLAVAKSGQPRTLRHTDAGLDARVARRLQCLPHNRATHVLDDGRQIDPHNSL